MDRRRAAGALFALAACFATATAAPTSNHTALDLYDGPTEGCYYNFQHYGEGDRIMTNEPCLNCTCHNRMLMCYLRVCPFTKPIGQDCTVEKRADQCCPIVTCPDVPVDLLTSTSTTSPAEYGGTGVGKVDNYGCSINGKYFPEGAKVPPTPNKPCEHCYCIRNMTTCVMQECTLHVDGCTPIYHKDVCCPVRYFCDHPEDEPLQLDDMTTTVRPTPGFLLTTTTTEAPTTEIQAKRECTEDGQIYPDGALIKTEKPCVHCYCMKGDIVCVVQECGTPMENEGKNCTSMPPREGQCCPDTYICEGDEITTEMPLEEITTISPPEITTRRENVEGSGYRKEPGETYTEPSISFETEGSGEGEILPTTSSDLPTPKEQTTDSLIGNKFGVTDQGSPIVKTTESPAYEEKEQATTEPDKGLNTVPSETSEDEHSEPSILEHSTVKEEMMPTVTSTSLLQEISMFGTSPKASPETPETTSSGEISEKTTMRSSVQIEDENSQASTRHEDEGIESITETTTQAKLTPVSDESKTTPSEKISEETTEPTITVPTTVKSDSVTEVKLSQTTSEEVYNEVTVTDFTDYSSEPPLKEKTTTIHDLMVTESSTATEEKEISSPVVQEESTTQISEVTEPVASTEEQTTYKEIMSEETSEPSLFEKTTSVDAVTDSKVHRTTAPSIYEDDVTISTTHKIVEEVVKSTDQTTVEEAKTTVTENLVKGTDATAKPTHKQTLVPTQEAEGESTTEQMAEHQVDEERISTYAPSTEVAPQEEQQDAVTTTLQPRDKIQPFEITTLNPEDNEITEDILPPGRIPGEGDCLFNGVTYRNESSVPNRNKCETSCKCTSSIIKCDPIICSPPPEYMENCQLVYDTSESCCPTYICEETKETIQPQSHSQMSGTEIPTYSPSLQCSGDECEISVEKQTTTVLPESTKIPSSEGCGSEGCIGQVSDKTNISGEQPEKCVGDKCTSDCIGGDCQIPSLQVTPQHTPSKTIPQECQGSEECREDKTEIPVCQGESCISKTTTFPEISVPCEGASCPEVPQGCTSDKCIASDKAPTETPPESQVCSTGKDCQQIEEKDCQDDNCRRTEEHIQPPIASQEPPGAESTVTIPTTEQILLESTLTPESHSISDSDIEPELPNVIIDSSSEKTTSTEIPEKSETTVSPQITEGLEGENTVPHEEVTETEMHYTEQPMLTTSKVYTEKDMTTKITETEKEDTTSPAVTESQEMFTSSPVETETQREDTSSKSPETSLDETETDKPQTSSEFEPKKPDQQEQFTKAPELEQPTETTDFKTHDEQTEIQDQYLPSTSIPSIQQDISELKPTTEFIDQPTIMSESTEKLGETENIPTISEDIEKHKEQERTTISPELEKKTTILSLPDSTKQSTTQSQPFTSISTQEPITQEEMKTDLPEELVTASLKPEKHEKSTETPLSPDTILYDTESPIETVEVAEVSTEIPEIMIKRTESPAFEEQTEGIESYPTAPQSIITETPRKPEEITTPQHEIEEHATEILTTESYLSLETKPSEEPYKTVEPEILTETTGKPEEIITPEQEIQEEVQHTDIPTTEISIPLYTKTSEELDKIEQPELPTTEISLPLNTKQSEEPVETVQPELPTEVTVSHISEHTESTMLEESTSEKEVQPELSTQATVSHISESTESTILQESTSEKESLTEKPVQIGTELNIPVTITEEPSEGIKETEESQICDSESECKKSQVPEAEISPCQGDSCIQDKKGCDSIECSQSGLSPNATSTEICNKENGCEEPSQEESAECSDENCRKPATSDHKETSIPDIEFTTKTPGKLDEELPTKITFEPHLTETETPATEVPTFGFDRTTKEPLVEEPENEVTRLPVSIITYAPIATESHKYDSSEQTDVTQPEESATREYEVTTTESNKSETELPTHHDIIPEKDITVVPEEKVTSGHQEEVTETLAPGEVTRVQESSTEVPESPKTTEKGDEITEQPKISSPEENESTAKPDNDVSQTLIPEHPQPEIPQSEITTAGYSEVTVKTEDDHKSKDEENETEGPETFVTTPGLSTREPEISVSEQSEDETPEPTESEIAFTGITELPQITEKTTEPQKEYPETTEYLVELEEHPHEIKESISTLLPSEETITQEPADIHDTEKEHDIEISTQKSSQTEPSLQYTEKSPEDNLLSQTSRTDTSTTISEEILEKSTEPSISEEASLEDNKRPSSEQQVPDSSTEPKDEENEISTVTSTLPEEMKQTTQAPPKTEKPNEENIPETTQDILSSTSSTPEEFLQVTTKATSQKIDEDIATQSPSGVDKYTKPETSTDVYQSIHTTETQKPVFSDMPPTDEVPQPEDESNFPPSGSYEPEPDYGEEDNIGPGTCRYGGKVYVSAQQIPRDDPCDFCFCFRSDIICLQQSCPPPIHGCREEPIQGFCCPRYECPVSMATTLNVTTTTTTTTTTLPPHFLPHAYKGAAQRKGCQIKGHIYKVGEVVRASSGPCLHCICGGDGQMKCDPKVCTPEPMLRQMIAAAVSAKRRR